ncbi:hypothetical protein D3C73_1570720 [compost metagenome]
MTRRGLVSISNIHGVQLESGDASQLGMYPYWLDSTERFRKLTTSMERISGWLEIVFR